ncbi:hypothetical protein ACFQQB_20040 [Nonomuraea rubra]|uniref:hypothetical protein n=1 Tax=Nonomuraea rubra TaxID=46180 RepID=UPI003607FC2D
MGDFVTRILVVVAAVCLLPAGPAFAAPDDGAEKLFTFKDQRITESSGLAVSPTHDGLYYTHNDSAAAPAFYAVDGEGARGPRSRCGARRRATGRPWRPRRTR